MDMKGKIWRELISVIESYLGNPRNLITTWWLNQPILKNMLVKNDCFPKFRGEKQNIWNNHLAF